MPQLAPPGKFQADGPVGIPLSGGKLYTYAAGTSTPKATYTDAGLGTPNANPVILDARGEASVWLSGAYKLTLRDAADVLIWTVDDVRDLTTGGLFENPTFSGTTTFSAGSIAWPGNPTHSGNHSWTGQQNYNGNVVIGNASTDTLAIAPNAVTWQNNPTHSGNHTFSGTVTFSSGVTLTNTVGAIKSAVKTATTSRSSTTTLADDPHLLITINPGTWAFEVYAPVWSTTATTGGLSVKMAFGGATTNDNYTVFYGTGTIQPVTGFAVAAFSSAFNGSGAMIVATSINGAGWIKIAGSFTIASGGTLGLQWAQNTSNANAANVGIGAYLKATRIA